MTSGRAELTNARQSMEEMMDRDPKLRAEYERLGPRFQAINAIIGARHRTKVSQAELARRMGVSQAVVSRMLSGEHSPRLDTVAAAAKAMGYRLELRFVREQGVSDSAKAAAGKQQAARNPKQ